MPCSCSSRKASNRKAYSNSLPCRRQISRTFSSFPSGRVPVSAKRRPSRVDLPWSTCPTMTILRFSVGLAMSAIMLSRLAGSLLLLHVTVFAKQLHPAALILGPARAFRDGGVTELLNDCIHGFGCGFDRSRAGSAAKTAVPRAVAFVKVQIDDGDVLCPDVFPDVDLCPVQEGMDPDVCAFWEGGLKLVPQFRWLLTEIPIAMFIARREVALLGPSTFLIGAHPEDDPGIAFFCQKILEAVRLERRAAGDPPQGV